MQHIHLMGIGGYGINPIARVMAQMGYTISGCDLNESPLLAGMPGTVHIGHDPAHLHQHTPDALVVSSAIPETNAEIAAARDLGIPVYKRAGILGHLMQDRTGIAIAGTHGKTTTTAMLATTLAGCGLDPTFIIGGVSADLGTNAWAGQGDAFVIEADEYDGMFLGLRPRITVLTTLEMDHPDMFADMAAVRGLFAEFIALLPDDGLLIAGAHDAAARRFAEERTSEGLPTLTYGIGQGEWQAVDIRPNAHGGMDFIARHGVDDAAVVSLKVPGRHNVANALAALVVATRLGTPPKDAAKALATFSGIGRRFEVKRTEPFVVIDDYAHHPTAIAATLEAARTRYSDARRIWAVWEPHTYSRTAALLDDFAAAFTHADRVIVTDVFRSRDTDTFGVTETGIVTQMQHDAVEHISGHGAIIAHLRAQIEPGDVVIVMSAGPATAIAAALAEEDVV